MATSVFARTAALGRPSRRDGSPRRRSSLGRDERDPPSNSEGAPYRRASGATAPLETPPRIAPAEPALETEVVG